MVGGTHAIPGNGYVPSGKILKPVFGAFALVSAVFYVRAKAAVVPNTISRDWEDASLAYGAAAPREGDPSTTVYLNPFTNGIPASQSIRPVE